MVTTVTGDCLGLTVTGREGIQDVTGQDIDKLRKMERRQDRMRTSYGNLTERRTPCTDVDEDYLKVSSD